MKRRNFIKLSATASAIGLLPFEMKAMLKQLSLDECDFSHRKLVLINLKGGNDGLNTVVPINQYDTYSLLRPNIKLANSGLNSYITLDSTLAENQKVGLNPALTSFKSMYDKGWLKLIQSVGYPSHNRSHFSSKDIMSSGNDGNSWLNGTESGLFGRFMELNYADELNESYPLAVQIGSKSIALDFIGVHNHGMAINITGQDPSGFYSVLSGLSGQAPQFFPNSHYGAELEYIVGVDNLSNQYSQSISNAFNNGTNNISYPDTNLADQLKTVAKLISGGLNSKVYLVKISGFDTHNNQVQDSSSPIGEHYELLTELSTAVDAFFNDLDSQGIADDVVGATYSEFGRKAAENGNMGTDHGQVSPMFVFGKPIQAGVSGVNPDLTEANSDNNYQIESLQYDYRETFATIFQDFMGADFNTINGAFYNHTSEESFVESKINGLIKDSHLVPEDCYEITSNSSALKETPFEVFPNPFKSWINISSNYSLINFSTFEVYSLNGQLIYSGRILVANRNTIKINLTKLKGGHYILKINSNNGSKEFKIIKS